MASIETYNNAIEEAERFIAKAQLAIADIELYKTQKENGVSYPSMSNINTAAAKRASMDLTRSLVHVRR